MDPKLLYQLYRAAVHLYNPEAIMALHDLLAEHGGFQSSAAAEAAARGLQHEDPHVSAGAHAALLDLAEDHLNKLDPQVLRTKSASELAKELPD